MAKFGKLVIFVYSLAAMAFSSCSARIEGSLREGGAAELRLETGLKPAAASRIRFLRDFMGAASGGPVLDGESISRGMAAAPGIQSVSLGNTGPSSLEGSIIVSDVDGFLAAGETEGRFVSYREGRTAGTSSLVVALDRKSAPQLIPRLSPEAEEYLTALMAPAVLGEDMGRQEYLDTLALFYDRALADEVASARILVNLEFPRPVTYASGGAPEGKIVRFDIPLLDVLVLDRPLRYEVKW